MNLIFLKPFLGLLGLALVASGAFAADAPQKIRIAYASRSSSAIPQYMAGKKVTSKQQALDVEIIQMNPRLGAAASHQRRRRLRDAVHQHFSRRSSGLSDEACFCPY